MSNILTKIVHKRRMNVVCRVVEAIYLNRQLYKQANEMYSWNGDQLKSWPIESNLTFDHNVSKLRNDFHVPYTQAGLYGMDFPAYDNGGGSIQLYDSVINFKLRLNGTFTELDFYVPSQWLTMSSLDIMSKEYVRLFTKLTEANK